MTVTDISKAGLEPGCKVRMIHLYGREATVSSVDKDDGTIMLCCYIAGRYQLRGPFNHEDVERDRDDAQEARSRRLDELLKVFPVNQHIENWTDLISEGIRRFILIQQSNVGHLSACIEDTFDEVVDFAGGEVLDGMMPEGVFDLDTGERIDLHVSSPIVTRAEDQGIVVNALDPEDRADLIERLGHEGALDVLRNHRPVAEAFKCWTITIGSRRTEEAHDVYVHNTHTADLFIDRLIEKARGHAYATVMHSVPVNSSRPDREAVR